MRATELPYRSHLEGVARRLQGKARPCLGNPPLANPHGHVHPARLLLPLPQHNQDVRKSCSRLSPAPASLRSLRTAGQELLTRCGPQGQHTASTQMAQRRGMGQPQGKHQPSSASRWQAEPPP